MSQLADVFSTDTNDIEIGSVGGLAKVCKYHPYKKDQFMTGLKLAEDLINEQGVTLYTAGTNITPDRITRLINITENNPEMELKFKIKRSTELINNFRADIISKVRRLTTIRQNYKVYSKMIGSIAGNIESFVNDLLADESIVLTIYKMKFAAESTEDRTISLFFSHTVSVALFTFAIAQSSELKETLGFSNSDYHELLKAAFFHNMGAVMKAEEIMEKKNNELRLQAYYEANRGSGFLCGDIWMSADAHDAMQYVCDYNFGKDDFVNRFDIKACRFANILLIADKYVQAETGFLGPKIKPSQIVDSLNLQAHEGKLSGEVVKALTIGLKLKNIFDFYQEMDYLKNLCTFRGGKNSIPYPMTGFKSPTIFVCKADACDCDHYETSLKAVTLIRKTGPLCEGKYARCLLTTPKLMDFYENHYKDIKNDVKRSDLEAGERV